MMLFLPTITEVSLRMGGREASFKAGTGSVWCAPVGAPPSHLHPSRLEGWRYLGETEGVTITYNDAD